MKFLSGWFPDLFCLEMMGRLPTISNIADHRTGKGEHGGRRGTACTPAVAGAAGHTPSHPPSPPQTTILQPLLVS